MAAKGRSLGIVLAVVAFFATSPALASVPCNMILDAPAIDLRNVDRADPAASHIDALIDNVKLLHHPSLKNKVTRVADDDVTVETTHTNANFAGSPYEYLGKNERLTARFSTVMADTVRPRAVQIAAHAPPIAEGALQETTYVHSGEVQTSGIDLNAGGRGGLDVLADRTYLSRTIGGTAFGSGWDSMLFRRLRPLPNGNVEYRDGFGEVWVFTQSFTGDYTSPLGLFLKLTGTDRGWMLVDQQRRQTHFDQLGRLSSETDHFYDGKGGGSITRYLYDDKGRLVRVVDPVRRETSIAYNDTGQIEEISDWRGRKVKYTYSSGRLTRVELPEAKAAAGVPAEFDHSGAKRPRIEYTYDDAAATTLNQLAEEHTNLKTIRDPPEVAANGLPRVTLTYVADQVREQKWATGENATFTYGGTPTVVDALGQKRVYELTDPALGDQRAHIAKLTAEAVPVLQFSAPVLPAASPSMSPAPQSLATSTTYTVDGQVWQATLPSSLAVEATFKTADEGAPGMVVASVRESGAGVAARETTYTREPSSNLVQKVGRSEGTSGVQERDTPQPSLKNKVTRVPDDEVTGETTHNDAGQVTKVVQKAKDGSTTAMTSEIRYYEDSAAPVARSRPRESLSGGDLQKSTFSYQLTADGGERVEVKDAIRNTATEATFDSLGRRVREIVRDSDGAVLADERFGYDASGQLAYHARTQSGVGVVETRVRYDAIGRAVETSTTGAVVDGSPTTLKATTTYDLPNRKITQTDPAAGASAATTISTLDTLGRVQSVERTAASSQKIMQRYAYDAMSRLTFESDGVRVARIHQYDLFGRPVKTGASDGTSVSTVYTPWGEAERVIARDALGAIVAETKNFFTRQGRRRSSNEAVGPNARKTHVALLEGGRRTVTRVGEVAGLDAVDLAGGLHRAHESLVNPAGQVIEERLREIGPTFDPASDTDTWAKTARQYIGGLPVTVVTSEPRAGADYQTVNGYDGLGRMVQQTQAGAYVTAMQYDEASNVLSVTAPGMEAETASYDSRGLVTKRTLADGKTNEYRYDALGNVRELIDEAGRSTFYDRDLLGRPSKIRYADETFEETTYEDVTGAVKATRDRAGQWLSYSYDSAGRTVGVHSGPDPASAPLAVKYDYDAAGRVQRVRNKDAGIGYDDHDQLGRPRITRALRYRAQTGLSATPELLDEHTQRHTWSIHEGERASWRMPAVGASIPVDLPAAKWLDTIVETRDAGSNVVAQTKAGGAVLTSANGRSAGRISTRSRHLQSGSTIGSRYGFADGSAVPPAIEMPPVGVGVDVPESGLALWSETLSGTRRVAGSANARDAALRLTAARDLGSQRISDWDYDGRGRLTATTTTDGAITADTLIDADFRQKRNATPFLTPAQHVLLDEEAAEIEPLTWTATPTNVHGIDARTLTLDGVDVATRDYTFAGGRRTGDGVWSYTFDELGRMSSATAGGRRIELTWDPNDRLVGRVAYASDGASGWKLETRTNVLARDGLPAASTFVWDPVVDRLVAVYAQGASTAPDAGLNAGLLRQYLHADRAYDDPIRVLVAAATGGDPETYFPVADESGTGSLTAVLDASGALVERVLYADAYGDAPRYLNGAVAEKIALHATKDAAGNLANVTVRVHLSESIDTSTLAAGARLASLKADKTLAQLTAVTPDLETPYIIRWSLTAAEWNALAAAPGAETLEVSLTSALRAETWGPRPPMPLPSWARRLRPGADATDTQPVIYREPLAAVASFTSTIANGASETRTLLEIESLYLAAAPESKTKLLTAFKSAPFVEPATGLVYLRARWYDATTGAWLTPDPIGYSAGSSNLYAGFNNDPVNNIDPDGEEAFSGAAVLAYLGTVAVHTVVDVAIDAVWHEGVDWWNGTDTKFDWHDSLQTNFGINLISAGWGGKLKHLAKLRNPILRKAATEGAEYAVDVAATGTIDIALHGQSVSEAFGTAAIGGLVGRGIGYSARSLSSGVRSGYGHLQRAGVIDFTWGSRSAAQRGNWVISAGRRSGYGVSDDPVRVTGNWTINDIKQALLGHPPRGLGSPDLHHADQMPGSGIHEVLPDLHRNNAALHPNKFNQGVTPEMRERDRRLHWWYRAREQGADELLPGWVYDK